MRVCVKDEDNFWTIPNFVMTEIFFLCIFLFLIDKINSLHYTKYMRCVLKIIMYVSELKYFSLSYVYALLIKFIDNKCHHACNTFVAHLS